VPAFDADLVLIGCVGGLLPDVLRFVKQRYRGFPDWFSKAGYWVGLLLLVLIGGGAAWLGQASDWKAALAMGFGGPEFFSRLVSTGPGTRGSTRDAFIRKWWAA